MKLQSTPCAAYRAVTGVTTDSFSMVPFLWPAASRLLAPWLRQSLRPLFRWLLAAIGTTGLILGASWVVTFESAVPVLQAIVWAAGFLFLALAIEARSEGFVSLLLTGLALLLLAGLSTQVAANEFIIVAAAVLGAWLAVVVPGRPAEPASLLRA